MLFLPCQLPRCMLGELRLVLVAHYLHFGNAPTACRQHLKGGLIEGGGIAGDGDFIQLRVEETAERIVVGIVQVHIGDVIEIIDTDLGIEDILVGANLLVEVLFAIKLVFDIADDLFHQVFDGDETGDGAILIDDNHHVDAALAYLAQQVIQTLGLRHKVGRAQQVANGHMVVTLAQLLEHVSGVENTDNVINIVFVDRNARETALQGKVNGLIDVGIAFQRHHIDARDHHLAHRRIGELEDAADHLGLFLFKHALFFTHRDEQAQFFLGHEGAAMLHLPTAHQPDEEIGNRAQRPDNRAQEPGRAAYRANHYARPAQRVLHGSRLGRDLTEDQHDERDENSSDHLAKGGREGQRQHSRHAGSDNNGYTVDDENGRKKNIGLREQTVDL